MIDRMTSSAPPVPTGSYANYFPASVVLPDGAVWHQCRVLFATTGVYVYRRAGTGSDLPPDFFAEVVYTGPKPAARLRTGYTLDTADGQLTITSANGCGCGNKLKRWSPSWAYSVLPWPA